jgi:hypothetical protein
VRREGTKNGKRAKRVEGTFFFRYMEGGVERRARLD